MVCLLRVLAAVLLGDDSIISYDGRHGRQGGEDYSGGTLVAVLMGNWWWSRI